MRTCDGCGSRMPPYFPRKTVGGMKLCEGCQKWHAPRTAMHKTAELDNPIHDRTGHDADHWFHGSHHEFPEFGEVDDTSHDEDHYGSSHWNTLLGHHFTSDHQVASDFASGHHTSAANMNEEADAGRVIHAKLHLSNPKVYASEHDMDQEVHEFEHARGNTIDSHFPPPGEDADDDELDDYQDEAGKARFYGRDAKEPWSKNEPDPAFAYGFHPKATGWLNTHPDKDDIARRFKKRLEDAGHDGVVYGNEYEESFHGKSAKSAIAFHPHQIEIAHDHTVNQNCKQPEDIGREPGKGQVALPGMNNLDTKRPFHPSPRIWEGPTTWQNPKIWRGASQAVSEASQAVPNRLVTPLPQECWERYYARFPAQHTAAKHTYTMTTQGPQGYQDVEREVEGPLYHGGRAKLQEGGLITPGRKPNAWGDGTGHVYFSTDQDTALDYATQTKGHLYEVEPTGDFKPDHHQADFKSKHPLKVIRKVPKSEWPVWTKTSTLGEESAANHAGKQTVWTVSSPNGTTRQLCQYHRGVHQSLNAASNGLAGSLGIPTSVSELLEGSQRGRCADCSKDSGYALKLSRPEGYDQQQAKDSKQPRRRKEPYMPQRTKSLTPLKQSENAARQTWYHGTSEEAPIDADNHGPELQPKGGELHLHSDEQTAWRHAIKQWSDRPWGRAFPHVYSVSTHDNDLSDAEPTTGGGIKVNRPLRASTVPYDHEKHPPIRQDHEEGPILYHGTSHEHDDYDHEFEGHEAHEHIAPASQTGSGPTFASNIASPNHAYATYSPHHAWSYAETHAMENGGVPHVYRVTPTVPEDLEKDPHENEHGHSRGNRAYDMRSKSGFDVLGEVPLSHANREHYTPEHEEEDDDDWGESHYGVKTANTQMELFHAEPVKHQSVPKPEPKAEEDDDHEPDECEHCGEDKNSGEHSEHHDNWAREQKWHTDWDEDRTVGAHNNNEIQRGMAMSLPRHVHDVVHDESRPMEERGKALADHIIKSVKDHGHIGRFWTDEDSVSRNYAESTPVASSDEHDTGKTPVVVHVGFPGYHHIETDPDELEHHGVYSYHIDNNREVPLQHGTPLEVKGVSWAPERSNYYNQSHRSEGHEWKRHDLKEPIKAMSSKKLPSLRQIVAHDATENQDIRHCPFCGSGKIIGRADGSVECEFCHQYFTVQVQPQYPNFPQTIDGQAQQVPGMPGQVEQPAMEGGGAPMAPGEDPSQDAGNPFAQGGDEQQDEGGNPFADDQAEEDQGGEAPPPFAKKSSLFKTASGASLDEGYYVNHLALSMTDDRSAMLAIIRGEQGA